MSSSARAGAASARASVAPATRIPSHLLICLNRSPAEDPSLGTIGLWSQRNMAQPAAPSAQPADVMQASCKPADYDDDAERPGPARRVGAPRSATARLTKVVLIFHAAL